MKIKKITWRSRRDFKAIYVCEHCDHEEKSGGYDDDNFHQNVIPKMVCGECKKATPETYEPQTTKYPANFII